MPKISAAGAAFVCLLCVAPARGQKSEEVFKNVQSLKGISVNEFMGTMGFFAASLGLNCTDCHISESSGDWARYADDTSLKRTTRRMIQMVNTINMANFGGRRAVTCYSCHRGTTRPKVIPSLAEQYGMPPPDDPNEVEVVRQIPNAPSADQILDRYIQALGGTQRLAALTSFSGKGTYQGYDTDLEAVPVDVMAKAPGQRTTIVHLRIGDSTTTYDGRSAWVASPDKPVRLFELTGQDIDGVKMEANLSFPSGVKQMLTRMRAGFPETTINDKAMQVVEGVGAGGSRVKLFFDKQSGLLTRTVRYTVTAVGTIPAQMDYLDYRDVAGVKVPFKWISTWTDGQSTTELSEVQANVAIDGAKFAKPAEAPPPKVVTRQ